MLMESYVSPASSLSVDFPKTESSVEETRSWDSEHVEDALEFPGKSEKPFEENDIKSKTNLVELGDGDTRPYEEFEEERKFKKPADSQEISGEDNDYERSGVPKLPEDDVDETNKNEGDENVLQAADDCTLAGMENTFPENISAEVINGDCCDDIDDLHQSENSEGKGQVEEVQTAGDPEQTESVKNEESEMGMPIQDSDNEPSVAKSVEPDGVAEQKSVENMASGSENGYDLDIAKSWPETKSLSIDTKRDNYESESREGNAKQINVNSEISIEFSPEPEFETSSFHFDPGQAGDDVKQIQESNHDFVLEPVSTPEPNSFLEPASTPESDSLLALRNNEDLNPDSFLEPASTPKSDSLLALRNYEDLNPDSFLEPASTPKSDSLLALRNNEDLNPDSLLEPASTPESDSLLALRNNEDLNPDSLLEPASTPESDSLLALRNNEDLNPDSLLEPASTPESDSLLAPRNNEGLNQDSFLEPASTPESNSLLALRNNEDLNPDSFLEPASTPESDSLLALRNSEDLNPDSFIEPPSTPESNSLLALRNYEDLNPESFLEPASTPESDSLLVLRNNEDLNPDSTEHASLTVPESDSSSIFTNGKVVMAESAEDAKFLYTNTDESFNQLITSTIDSTLDEPLGEPFHAEQAGDTGADNGNNPEAEVMDTEAVREQNSEPEVEDQDVCFAEEQGEEPKEMAETDSGLTERKEENFPFSAEELPQVGFEVDGTDIQEMEDNPKKSGNTIEYEGDSSPAVESGAKNDGEDAKIVETELLNVAAGDQTYTDKSISVETERSVVAESGNRDQQSENEIQIQAKEKMAKTGEGSRDQNRKESENSRGIFLQRIWRCCGVFEWMRSWRD